MNPTTTTRVDLHCHSTASEISKLGIQRSLGLPECATSPEEVYELAKRRGMDLVTITDHDTIAGALEIADRPDVFISEELTAWFRGEEQAVHVLCFGITPDDHERLQELNRDLEACAEYLHSNEIACSLAHPFYAVEAPLTPAHRRRLAELFPVWETRNGSRARELNMPAAIYIETHGGAGTGGSDDHAGVDIGRTFTETPSAVNAGTVSELHPRGRSRRARRAGKRRQVGAQRDGASDPRAAAQGRSLQWPQHRRPRDAGGRSGGGAEDGRAGDERGRRAQRLGRRRPRPRGRAGAARCLRRCDRPRPARARADRTHAVRRVQPRRARAPRPPGSRTPHARGRREHGRRARGRRRRDRRRRGRRLGRQGPVPRGDPGDPIRARRGLPRQGEAEAERRRGPEAGWR